MGQSMLKSVTARAALKASALSAFFLMLSGGSVPAQAPRALEAGGKPGTATVMIAPAAKVVSTVHYQANLILTCLPSVCSGKFPAPGAHRRLNVTRMTCSITGPTNSTFYFGELVLYNANQHVLLVQHLPGEHTSQDYSSLNRAVDVQAVSTQYIGVTLALVGGNAIFAACDATGTMDTLQ